MVSKQLHFDTGHRILVFAPHPDDETIAAGALIQSAMSTGAAVRVLFATDGDNNPWPQRWLERRWHIGAVERARWGERRRREALAAALVLGIKATSVRFLGWPDQGLTDCLMRDAEAEEALAAEIARFAPTHVVLPTLSDHHPDHSALRVMIDLALLRGSATSMRLGYVLHGPPLASATHVSASDAASNTRKHAALLTYETQISLSRNRLSRLAHREESFDAAEPRLSHSATSSDLLLRLPLPPYPARFQQHTLLLVLAGTSTIRRLRIPLKPLGALRRGITLNAGDAIGGTVYIRCNAQWLELSMAGAATGLLQGYVKLERARPRLVIFDAAGWRSIDECLVSDRQSMFGRDDHLPARVLS
ncbi:MAG: PIG-L family deacetylase [Rhodanobacteraceae bacterium]